MATINRLLRGMQTITINCNRQSRLLSNSSNEFRGFKGFKHSRNVTPIQVLSAVGGTLAIYTLYECRKNQGVEAAAQAKVVSDLFCILSCLPFSTHLINETL